MVNDIRFDRRIKSETEAIRQIMAAGAEVMGKKRISKKGVKDD